jgi:molybdenum cofactor guanylyltransferase
VSAIEPARRRPCGRRVVGLVLAGGRGLRVGGRDKGLLEHLGRPMVAAPVQALAVSCEVVLISANRNLARYARFADGVVRDATPDFPGPLGGISAGLRAAAPALLVVVPCDVQNLKPDLPIRLVRALRLHAGADAAVTRDERRLQPLVAALRGHLAPSIEDYLRSGGRSVIGWLETLRVTEVKLRGVIDNRNVTPVGWRPD